MFFLKSLWMTILAVILLLAFTWCIEDVFLRAAPPVPVDDPSAMVGHV